MRVVPAVMCACGERTVATRVKVEWADGPRFYWYCQECADDIVECCYDSHQAVRRAAIEHLPFLDDPRAVPILIAGLRHPDPLMRSAAAQALSRVEDQRTVEPLLLALNDSDSWVRYFASRALGDQRREAAVGPLSRLSTHDPAGHVRLAALDALGNIGSAAVTSR